MEPYSFHFLLTGPRGNNAFSYKERGPEPTLYVPALKEASLKELSLGEEIVFADHDEHGVLQNCRGLKFFIKTEWQDTPLIVMDNHNHAFYFWYEAYQKWQKPATLIHVDQHKDMRIPGKLFQGKTLEEAYQYTQYELNVGNYIVPAKEAGVISEIHFVTSEAALEEEFEIPKGPLILNVDLDFFAPELSYIPFEKAKKRILDWAKKATFITVATSAFFIEQKKALEVLNDLFEV